MYDACSVLLKKADAWQRAMMEAADSNRPVIDRLLLPRKSKLPNDVPTQGRYKPLELHPRVAGVKTRI